MKDSLARPVGFEPTLKDLEAFVLPLHQGRKDRGEGVSLISYPCHPFNLAGPAYKGLSTWPPVPFTDLSRVGTLL
jgi:hypothetical protein